MRLYRDTFRRLGLLGGQGKGQEDGEEQQPTGKAGERFRSSAAASRPVVLDLGQAAHPWPIMCGVSG
jgi:hypothetical protein